MTAGEIVATTAGENGNMAAGEIVATTVSIWQTCFMAKLMPASAGEADVIAVQRRTCL